MRELIREKNKQISELRAFLRSSDYKAIKYAEGEISAEEYAPTLAERKAWREEINALQVEVAELNRQYFESKKA